jgi:hypothetical protein
VSLIGTLEQFKLAEVLQRLERHAKTGLLIIQQSSQWIEFYISDGHLLCIGPLRTQATLGERLVQDGVIPQGALQETLLVLGNAQAGESQTARKLIELRYASREALRAWTIRNTTKALKVLLLWESGDIYFEEGTLPPNDRLLVSMSLSSLIEEAKLVAAPPPPPVAKPKPRTASIPAVYSPVNPPAPSIYAPITPITPMTPVMQPAPAQTPPLPPTPRTPSTPSPDVARVPTLMSASQFLDDSSFAASSFATSFPATEPFGSPISEEAAYVPQPDAPSFADVGAMFSNDGPNQTDSGFASLFGEADMSNAVFQPIPVSNPVPPRRIDTSFMVPEMVLLPKDLSAYREQNPQVQITPDQWCILTHVDGRTSLLSICQDLGTTPEIVCPVVGELIAEELITVSMPSDNLQPDLAPVSGELVSTGLSNGYVAPGYASAAVSPWSASLPAMSQPEMNPPSFVGGVNAKGVVTESQWGNGGNGAKFVPGRGWIAAPQSMQPLQSSGPLASPSGIYNIPLNNDY